jgi:hypothetical protein
MSVSGVRARSSGIVLAAALLLAAALGGSALAQDATWELGRLQLLADRPASGPLRSTLARGSLASYRFVSAAGIAFGEVATPGPTLGPGPIRVAYDRSRPDGQRLVVTVGGVAYPQPLPDWILAPVARYADSPYQACVSLFGQNGTAEHFDIVYHEAFQNQLLGLRLLHADVLLFDLNETWRLPLLSGQAVLGPGEAAPGPLDRSSAVKIHEALRRAPYRSWLLTDSEERIQVDLAGGELRFTGHPYYFFWTSDLDGYRQERDRLGSRAKALRATPEIREYLDLFDRLAAMEPRRLEWNRLVGRVNELERIAPRALSADQQLELEDLEARLKAMEPYRTERARTTARLDALKQSEPFREHADLVQRIDAMEPRVEASPITAEMRELRSALRAFNPAVDDAVTRTMHYAAFFRYVKQQDPAAWGQFLETLRSADDRPLATPTRWAKTPR